MRDARLSHSITPRRDRSVEIRVLPGDGRYPESFRVSRQEMRRFAWAVLADLDPDEAELAREEELAAHAEQFAFEVTDLGKYALEKSRA